MRNSFFRIIVYVFAMSGSGGGFAGESEWQERGPKNEHLQLILVECDTFYDDCVSRAEPYCKEDTAKDSDVNRAVDYAACLSLYQDTCKKLHC